MTYIDVLVQEKHNAIANALELHLSCSNPIYPTFVLSIQHAYCNITDSALNELYKMHMTHVKHSN